MKTKHGKTRIPRNYLRLKGKGNMKTAMYKYFAKMLAELALDIQATLINKQYARQLLTKTFWVIICKIEGEDTQSTCQHKS